MMDKLSFLQEDLQCLRRSHPLVHCITNQVAMDWTANLLLAAGASPIMSSVLQEVTDLSRSAESLVINIGTIDDSQLQTMLAAGSVYQQQHRPIVLDPVGIGSSRYREQSVQQLLSQWTPTIIRGNASEIAVLAGDGGECTMHNAKCRVDGRGVDSTIDSSTVVAAAERKAKEIGCVIAISGATDYITDGLHTEQVHGGSPLMKYVTAMGCGESALMAAMAAVQPDAMRAAVSTFTLMGLCGEKAAEIAQGPGSFRQNFLDQIYAIGNENENHNENHNENENENENI
ncbi:MAG: hydroxyethylthiazole kinase [Bacteroidales bacterium]|nr:hydroxyethylthiazole kinase [Candidatus Colicola coprequi]